MNLSSYIAKHLRDVHFGGNWTSSNLKDTLADVSWQEATTVVHSCNSIAVLVYHIHYFISVAMKVLQGQSLVGNDKYSFDVPPINSQQDWEHFVEKIYADAEHFASLVEKLPESILWEVFADAKYGSYFRNLQGIIEHTHYHLGQIVILKKLVRETS